LNQSSNTTERIRHYLETRQPHLLKAYDASFLADVIQAKKAVLSQDWMSRNAVGSRHFDWSQTLGGELGA
jgi:hypothetical protein